MTKNRARDDKGNPHEVDLYVGKRIKVRRNLLGMSQEDFGAAIGVTFQQVQKYETGANRISASRIYAVARVLRCEVAYFFEELLPTVGDGSEKVIDPMATAFATQSVVALNKICKTDKRREVVLGFLQEMAARD